MYTNINISVPYYELTNFMITGIIIMIMKILLQMGLYNRDWVSDRKHISRLFY